MQNSDKQPRERKEKRFALETYFPHPRTKALKEKKKKKVEERKKKREKGVSISQEGFREHPQLFVEHAIKREADKRHPATKEQMQSRHFKHVQQLAFMADISNKGY